MIKNLLIGLAVVVLIFAGFWIFKSGKKNADVVAENVVSTTASTSVKNTTSSGSIKNTVKTITFTNILPQTGNYECKYEEVSQTSRSSHTVYLSGGKMRGEFRTTTANGGTSNITVYDGTYLYTWVEGQTVGVRTQPTSIADFPSIIPKDILNAKVLGSGLNSVSWECHPWSKVPSLLAKPSYVKF